MRTEEEYIYLDSLRPDLSVRGGFEELASGVTLHQAAHGDFLLQVYGERGEAGRTDEVVTGCDVLNEMHSVSLGQVLQILLQ